MFKQSSGPTWRIFLSFISNQSSHSRVPEHVMGALTHFKPKRIEEKILKTYSRPWTVNLVTGGEAPRVIP